MLDYILELTCAEENGTSPFHFRQPSTDSAPLSSVQPVQCPRATAAAGQVEWGSGEEHQNSCSSSGSGGSSNGDGASTSRSLLMLFPLRLNPPTRQSQRSPQTASQIASVHRSATGPQQRALTAPQLQDQILREEESCCLASFLLARHWAIDKWCRNPETNIAGAEGTLQCAEEDSELQEGKLKGKLREACAFLEENMSETSGVRN
eukprot:XP_008767043.1 PREDICTED: uncharacterized protein LOC103690779 [Rattus norvegicus]